MARCSATARLGLLRQLLARATGVPGDVLHPLSDLALPVTDTALWTVILCLPADTALPMALQALGQRAGPEAQARLTDLARRNGTGPTVMTYLETRGDPLLERGDMAALRVLLQDPEALTRALLPLLAPGADLVEIAQGSGAQTLQFDGFHPPETAGIWTCRPKATIRLHPDPDHPVTTLSGGAALLDAALRDQGQTVTVTAIEETTGRNETWSDTRPKGANPVFDWVLPLPGFTGPLRIELTLPACHTPRALGTSPDPRPLGLLLRALRIDSAQPHLAAAE